MKRVEFEKKIQELGYQAEKEKEELIIRCIDGEWYGFLVARILLDEEFAVHFDYCVPYTKELYVVIFEFISTPLDVR